VEEGVQEQPEGAPGAPPAGGTPAPGIPREEEGLQEARPRCPEEAEDPQAPIPPGPEQESR